MECFSVSVSLWEQCLNSRESEFSSQQFNTWIRPLQAEYAENKLVLYAPNRFVLDWIVEKFLVRINELVEQFTEFPHPPVSLEIGSKGGSSVLSGPKTMSAPNIQAPTANTKAAFVYTDTKLYQSNLNPNFTFDN